MEDAPAAAGTEPSPADRPVVSALPALAASAGQEKEEEEVTLPAHSEAMPTTAVRKVARLAPVATVVHVGPHPTAPDDAEPQEDEDASEDLGPCADEDLLDGEPLHTEDIQCAQSRVRSISALGLGRFKQVIRLCLRQNVIRTIDGLEPVAATLKELDLYDNAISKIEALDTLDQLTSLDLSFNRIRLIENLNQQSELEELYLIANRISVISGLDLLANLRSLELGSNRIRKIGGLDSLCALERLWLAKNKITEISGLESLSRLRLLSIQANRISDLSPLRGSPQLEELYVSDNALTSIKGICNNEKLRVLDITNNKVASLDGLAPLRCLEELWASYNQVADFGELDRNLADKTQLHTVYFEHCPLQTNGPALYRNKVRLAVPQLKQIDATFVTA